MICVSIRGPTFFEAFNQIKASTESADLFELRLDLFDKRSIEEINKLMKSTSKPILLTLRSEAQGGKYNKSSDEKINELRKFVKLEPDFIDIEHDTPVSIIHEFNEKFPKIKIILSYHNMKETPSTIEEIVSKMKNSPTDYYKIATFANDSLEALRIVELKKRSTDRLIAIPMGEVGSFGRIMGRIMGNPITFASANDDLQTAPGQLSIKILRNRYQFEKLNNSTEIYGLIGDPVTKSISDITHNELFGKLNLNSTYVKMKVEKKELKQFFNYAKQLKIHGLSVTMPLKEDVMDYVDHISSEAKQIGAVNTLLFENGLVYGFNTDSIGALNAIEKKGSVAGKKVIIIGAGGAAKAIAYEAIKRGAKVYILNRTLERAVETAKNLSCFGESIDQMKKHVEEGYDILINATPDSCPIDPNFIIPKSVVFETKTLPVLSDLLKFAMEKDCKLVYGYEMFMEQAIEQFNLWLKGKVDLKLVRSELMNSISSTLQLDKKESK